MESTLPAVDRLTLLADGVPYVEVDVPAQRPVTIDCPSPADDGQRHVVEVGYSAGGVIVGRAYVGHLGPGDALRLTLSGGEWSDGPDSLPLERFERERMGRWPVDEPGPSCGPGASTLGK